MGIIERFINKIFSSYITIGILGIFAFLAVVIVPWFLTDDLQFLRSTSQVLVQLNITVAIGLGALYISLSPKEGSIILVKEILILMLISTFGFFVSLLDGIFIQKTILFLNGLVLVGILSSIAKYIRVNVDITKRYKDRSRKKKTKSNIKINSQL